MSAITYIILTLSRFDVIVKCQGERGQGSKYMLILLFRVIVAVISMVLME